jgi:hypothetical protein
VGGRFLAVRRPHLTPTPRPNAPPLQAAELGIQLYEQNEELTAKLAESQEELDRLKALIVDTNQELTSVGVLSSLDGVSLPRSPTHAAPPGLQAASKVFCVVKAAYSWSGRVSSRGQGPCLWW